MEKVFKFTVIGLMIISVLSQWCGVSAARTPARSSIFHTIRKDRTPKKKASKQNLLVKDINILFLRGDYKNLVADGENAIKHAALGVKDRKEILYLMGLSCIKLGHFNKARKVVKEILDMKGDGFNEEAIIGIADSYFDEKNFDRAIESYKDAIRKYPESDRLSGIYFNLGLCYKAKKNPEKTNFYFQKIKEKYSMSFEANKIEYETSTRKITYYIIQLGAFRSLRNAKRLGRKLARKKHDYYIQKVRKNGKIIYRVRGGKFSNKYYAMRLLKKLRRDGFVAKIIIE